MKKNKINISLPQCESMMYVCVVGSRVPMQDPHIGSLYSVGHCSQLWPCGGSLGKPIWAFPLLQSARGTFPSSGLFLGQPHDSAHLYGVQEMWGSRWSIWGALLPLWLS